METVKNFAEMIMDGGNAARIPEGRMCAWVDCSDCVYSEWNPSQGAYWCRRWKEHAVQQGCSFGVEE